MSIDLLFIAGRRRWWLLAAALVMVALSSCSGSSAPAAGTDLPAETTSPPTTTPTSVEAQVVAAKASYLRFWEVWILANNPPDPDFPELDAVATGSQRALIRTKIADHRANRLLFRNRPDSQRAHRLSVLGASQEKIVLEDCNVDDGLILDAETLKLTNSEVSTHLWKATLLMVGGTWKVADNEQEQKWRGATSC